jgi:galactonate dehydratase
MAARSESTRGKRFGVGTLGLAAPMPEARPDVAITDVKARAVREPVGGRTHVIVAVKTSVGVEGIGEMSAHPDPTTAAARLNYYKQHVIGQDALSAEAVLTVLATGVNSSEVAPVQAAVNMALLDILGKFTKAPVYEVLGGSTREKARALARLDGSGEAELKRSLAAAHEAGFRAFSVPLTLPAGPTRGRTFYSDTRKLLEALRKEGGEDSDFVLDCGGQLTASEGVGLADAFERFHLLWLDEPTAEINHGAFAKIADENVTPVGMGRTFSDNARFQDLLREDAIDVFRPNIARMGVSEIRKGAALAEVYYVAVAPYHRGGPVATAAALQAAASLPNFFIQEVPRPRDERDIRMRRELIGADLEIPTNGFFALPEGPGLGVTLNPDAVSKYEVKL